MSKVKSISLRNYKAFGDARVTIEIKPVTLFIGKNSSGKSSLLKLISIMSDLTSGYLDGPMILDNEYISLGARYEDVFHNNQTSGLSLGIEYENGMKVDVSYYVDKGDLFIYKYTINDSEIRGDGKRSDAFKGFLHDDTMRKLGLSLNDLSFRATYVGPVRVQPDRNILAFSENGSHNVGGRGQHTYSLLLKSYLSDDKQLYCKVSDWLDANLEGQRIYFERNSPASGTYSLYVRHNIAKVNIADVGQGLAQVLPIITQSFLNKKEDILIVEQPALHLHPAAHASVAYRLADSALDNDCKCVIETHSENFLLAIRNMVADKTTRLKAEDVVVYFVDSEDDEAILQTITIDDEGRLSTWPEGIFSESFELLSQIMKHQE